MAVAASSLERGDGQSARLVVREIQIDPSSGGARLAQRASLDLVAIGAGGNGARMYAYRSGEEAVFVVPTPGVWEYQDEGDERWGATSCDHWQLRLAPSNDGGPSAAVFLRGPVPTSDYPEPEQRQVWELRAKGRPMSVHPYPKASMAITVVSMS